MALFTPDGKRLAGCERAKRGLRDYLGNRRGVRSITESKCVPLEKTAQTGRYEVKIEELREATAEDKYRVAAEYALSRSKAQFQKGTLEERRKCIEKYQEALELYKRAGASRERKAGTLNDIG